MPPPAGLTIFPNDHFIPNNNKCQFCGSELFGDYVDYENKMCVECQLLDGGNAPFSRYADN